MTKKSILAKITCFRGFATGPGYGINFNDIGGNFAGIVFGLSNTIATTPGFFGPYLVGIMTKNVKMFLSLKISTIFIKI